MSGRITRFLRVNLSTGEIKVELVDEQVARDFVGGRGFGINYLYRELAPDIDPLSEHNKLLLLNGTLAGTNAQSVSRWMACSPSILDDSMSFLIDSTASRISDWRSLKGSLTRSLASCSSTAHPARTSKAAAASNAQPIFLFIETGL